MSGRKADIISFKIYAPSPSKCLMKRHKDYTALISDNLAQSPRIFVLQAN